jgi:hypothetical protein
MQERAYISSNPARRSHDLPLFNEIEERFEIVKGRQKKAEKEKRASKKDRIISLYKSGLTDIAQLAQRTASRPSYVATVLQNAQLLRGYYDLYTTTAQDQNIYSKFFRNVLSFKSPQAARESIERIDNLYRYFERIGDRAGQHHAQVLALTGRNRARWSGKHEEARIFAEWLLNN